MNKNDNEVTLNENLPKEKVEFLKSVGMQLVEFEIGRHKKASAKRIFLIPSILIKYRKMPLIYLLAFLRKNKKIVKIRANKKKKKEILIAIILSQLLPRLSVSVRQEGKKNGLDYIKTKDRELLAIVLLEELTARNNELKQKTEQELEELIIDWNIEWIDENELEIEVNE